MAFAADWRAVNSAILHDPSLRDIPDLPQERLDPE
jgi:hypothetical protein